MSERSTEHRAPGNKARSQGPEPPSIQESQDRLMSRRNVRGGRLLCQIDKAAQKDKDGHVFGLLDNLGVAGDFCKRSR